jgi:hypothetical protein
MFPKLIFDPSAYGPEVAEILGLEGDGMRLMPLAGGTCSSPQARELIRRSKLPDLQRAGLYVYFSCWNEAHDLVNDLDTPEGSYWHAIIHRQEPDPGNSAYWFRKVGTHSIFPPLLARAREIGLETGSQWDPFAFIDYCERARTQPGSEEERKALEVQRAEWQLLFDYCATT